MYRANAPLGGSHAFPGTCETACPRVVHLGAARGGHPSKASQPRPHAERALTRRANSVCSAAASGWLLLTAALAWACAPAPTQAPSHTLATAPPPSDAERYCAWYGNAREGVLYFGQAAFWSAYRAAGKDPRADLEEPGPQLVGRFDLRERALLEPLDVGRPGARSGVWDVHAHRNGRVYFTTYFEPMGWVEPTSGRVRHLPELGLGLNEIAPGPDDDLLVTRYGGEGAVVQISPDGELLAEHPLVPPEGYRAAPKTVAFDPVRQEIWVNSDLFGPEGAVDRHDTFVLGLDGALRRRIESPEIQFVAFRPDGSGARVELDAEGLWLVRTRPGAPEARLLLDHRFPVGLDFAQDMALSEDGSLLVTRWGGTVHAVDAGDRVTRVYLPKLDPDGLYYTAVPVDGAVCATYCADVSVVCRPFQQW